MIKALLDYAKNINLDLEVYAITNNELTIEYKNTQLSNYKTQNIKEYKLKALIDGVAVTASVLDISNPEEVIETLKMARTLTDELDNDSLSELIEIDNVNRKDISINPTEIKNNLKNINQELMKKYPEIFTITSEFNFEKDKYEISNTNDVKLIDFNYHGYYVSDVVLKINNDTLTCCRYLMAKEPDFNVFKEEIENSIKDTMNKVNHKSVKTDKYNIVLNNKCVFDLLNVFAFDFHAQTINRKQSVFTDKFEKNIFSENITIVEDPTNSELIGTRLFDGEGVQTYYKEIVKKGKFNTKLYNKKYAEQDGVKSTGNSYGVRNMYIIPGEKSETELLVSVQNCIYIDDLMGLHSGINHLTGDISIQCEGFLIEDGKKTKGLKQIVLSTNILELLSNVIEVGNNLEFFSTNGGAPSLLIKDITIAGKEV